MINSIETFKNMLPGTLGQDPQNSAILQFFETYLEFINSQYLDSSERINDIDIAEEEFIDNFRNEFLSNIPLFNQVKTLNREETIRIIKTAIDMNKSKGTTISIQYLFRTLFASEIDLQYGRVGVAQVAKPLDFGVVETNSIGNPVVSPNYDKFSAQEFIVLDNADIKRTGTSVTYFSLLNEDHIWVVSNDRINDDEILFFPAINSYLKVLTTDRLNLDGWNGKGSRSIDKDGFYLSDIYNPVTNKVLFDEINNVVYNNEIKSNTHVSLSLTDGVLSYGITQYPSTLTTYSYTFTGTYNGEIVHFDVVYKINSVDIVEFKINGFDRLDDFINDSIRIYSYDMLYANGESVISKDNYELREGLINTFSIIARTDINPSVYMNIIRTTMIPAGFRLIHLYLLSSAAYTSIGESLLYEGTLATPSLQIHDRSLYAATTYSIEEFDRLKFNTYENLFFGPKDLDHLDLSEFKDSYEYRSTPMYTIATSTVKPRLIISTSRLTIDYVGVTGQNFFGVPVNQTDILDSRQLKLHRINDMYVNIDDSTIININESLYHIFYRSTDVTVNT